MPPEVIELYKEVQKITATIARIEEKVDGMDMRITNRLDKLNGSVARHEQDIGQLKIDRSSAFSYISQAEGHINIVSDKVKELTTNLNTHTESEAIKETNKIVKENNLYWNLLSKVGWGLLIFLLVLFYNLLIRTELVARLESLPL